MRSIPLNEIKAEAVVMNLDFAVVVNLKEFGHGG